MKSQNILGFDVASSPRREILEQIRASLNGPMRRCAWLACLNPHSYALAKQDVEFASALSATDWLVPDGIGIVFAGRLLGRPVGGRVTGADIFEGVMTELDARAGSVFFLGGSEQTLRIICAKLPVDYPSVQLAGSYSPPFKTSFDPSDVEAMITAVNAAAPDVLWVGLTAPKQEKWIASQQHRLQVRFAGAIGAVFDFYTGQVQRSHPAFQSLGLEWLPRLLQEPRRLWRRMLISAPIFLMDVARERLGLWLSSSWTSDK